MAGIGFELKKMMDEDTFSSNFKAYLVAGIISAGPWAISIFCLGLLWMFSIPHLGLASQKLFRTTVIYTYAYSLITTGAIQLVVTRFLADRLFLRQKNIFLPTYAGLMLFTIVFQGATALIFYSFSDIDVNYKIIGVILYIAVSCIWQTMIFLSAARDFWGIVSAFFWGSFTSFVMAIFLGKHFGFNGHLLGFTIGQSLIVILLMYRIFCEFDSPLICNFQFLREVPRYFSLLLLGIFYYLAIWIDKIIYWYSASGEHIGPLFYSHYPYDSCMFLAFLTIIPALAHFMIDMETSFYDKYKGFYGAIVNKGSLLEIRKKKAEITKVIRESAARLLVLQTLITGVFVFFAPSFIEAIGLREEHIPVLRAAGIGAFFHVFLLVTLIIILYFDRKRAAVFVGLSFLVTNALFTLGIIKYAPEYMGWGYASAAFFSFLLAFILSLWNTTNIERLTFVEQPIETPKLPREASESE